MNVFGHHFVMAPDGWWMIGISALGTLIVWIFGSRGRYTWSALVGALCYLGVSVCAIEAHRPRVAFLTMGISTVIMAVTIAARSIKSKAAR